MFVLQERERLVIHNTIRLVFLLSLWRQLTATGTLMHTLISSTVLESYPGGCQCHSLIQSPKYYQNLLDDPCQLSVRKQYYSQILFILTALPIYVEMNGTFLFFFEILLREAYSQFSNIFLCLVKSCIYLV